MTLLVYSPQVSPLLVNFLILSSMQLTVIISGEDCYGWEVHWLIRFLPLRVESELANLFSAVMFFLCFQM